MIFLGYLLFGLFLCGLTMMACYPLLQDYIKRHNL